MGKNLKKEMIEGFRVFGLNKYEALAYVHIAKLGVATAKEISRVTEVPYSRVYDVLESLEKKGWIYSESSKPKRYRAEKIDRVLSRKKQEFLERMEKAEQELLREVMPYFSREVKKAGVWTIRGFDAIHARVLDIIASCSQELNLVVPYLPRKHEVKQISELIKKKVQEGVKLRIILGEMISDIPENCLVRFSKDRMGWLIIADSKEVLYGVPSGEEIAIWTNEAEMVRISRIMFEYLWEGSQKPE